MAELITLAHPQTPLLQPHSVTHSPDRVRNLVVDTLEAKSARDVVAIDLEGKSDIADYMVVATGINQRHVNALAGHIEEALRAIHIRPLRKEGESKSEWILIDNPLVIVHIFEQHARETYNLEKMWEADFNAAD